MKLKLLVALLVAAACLLGFFLGRFSAKSTRAEELERLETLTWAQRAQWVASQYLKHIPRPEPGQALPADDPFSRFFQLEAQLLEAGQTNLAVEVSEFAGAQLLSEYTRRANDAVGYLKMLRSGNTNVVGFLESALDDALSGLSDLPLGEKQLKALRAAKHYRAMFPRTTGGEATDEAVAKALNLVPDK